MNLREYASENVICMGFAISYEYLDRRLTSFSDYSGCQFKVIGIRMASFKNCHEYIHIRTYCAPVSNYKT